MFDWKKSEDIAQKILFFQDGTEVIVDLGYYPEESEDGQYIIRVVVNRDWEKPREIAYFKSYREAKAWYNSKTDIKQ